MKQYLKIINELEFELTKTKTVSENVLEQMEFAIGHCKIALDNLRGQVQRWGFTDREAEILFFKKIKPSVCSKLMYYQAVFDIESVRLELDKKSLRKYFQRELKKILKYMNKNKVKVQYYRCGHTHLDEKYFLRDNKEIPLELKDSRSMMDEEFSAWKDHTFSTIMANEMLIEYIKKKMEKLDHPDRQIPMKSSLKWTDDKIDLEEIVYALYFAGSINHGKATIKDIAVAFERIFNVELKNIYRSQTSMLQRANPAKYLSYLVAILQRRINDKLK